MIVSEREGDVLETLVTEAGRLTGQQIAPRLLRAAAALVEQAGYEIARTEETTRVTQVILLSAELERLGAAFEKSLASSSGGAGWKVSGRG